LNPPVSPRPNMTALQNPLRYNTKAVVFDVGGVLIDLHAEVARRELIEKYLCRRASRDLPAPLLNRIPEASPNWQ
jgi:hypothetical protein